MEDYDDAVDGRFVTESLVPYLRDLYKDLALRSFVSYGQSNFKEKRIDKVTFIQYCNLPGTISERLLKSFDSNSDGMITEGSFVSNLSKIFVGDLESRMRITFDM